jgi:hypothetical protein
MVDDADTSRRQFACFWIRGRTDGVWANSEVCVCVCAPNVD